MDLHDFQERMQSEIRKTKDVKSVHTSGWNLDEALKNASIELGVPVSAINFEILEKSNFPFPFLKASQCSIIAYRTEKKSGKVKDMSLEDERAGIIDADKPEKKVVDTKGRASVRLSSDGARLKVFPPQGDGGRIEFNEVMELVAARGIIEPDEHIIMEAVKGADAVWVKIGDFDYNPGANATCTVNVGSASMRAFITAVEPGPGGADLSADDIQAILNEEKITHGVSREAIEDFEAKPVYFEPYLVAKGSEPVHGNDARIVCTFETDPSKIKISERKDGSVDFRELNKYQNVVEGQTLVRKIPAVPGKDGRDVYNQIVPASDGRDMEILVGKNVSVSADGMTAVSTANGHAMYKSGRAIVDDVLIIPGNVDARTGNVNLLGSVDIKGNVEDGYSVTAQGRITVSGYVGKANLDAGGDIIVSRGINGGEESGFGKINAGKSIWTSFIQNASANAGEFVIVGAGIVNSDVTAQKKVLCRGRRARIVGAKVRAGQEINALMLGSPAGVETILQVGLDPKNKAELDKLREEHDELSKEKQSLYTNIISIKRQLVKKKAISSEKRKGYQEIRNRYSVVMEKITSLEEDIRKKEEYMEVLMSKGSISAAQKAYPGVILRIRDIEFKIRNSYDYPVTFVANEGFVQTEKFHEIKEDLWRSVYGN